MKDWLFKLLFRAEYEHMRHLVDDVIRLEEEKTTVVKSDTNTQTVYWPVAVEEK